MIGKVDKENGFLPKRDYWLRSSKYDAPVHTIEKNSETRLWKVRILWGTDRGKEIEVEERYLSQMGLSDESIRTYDD